MYLPMISNSIFTVVPANTCCILVCVKVYGIMATEKVSTPALNTHQGRTAGDRRILRRHRFRMVRLLPLCLPGALLRVYSSRETRRRRPCRRSRPMRRASWSGLSVPWCSGVSATSSAESTPSL